MPITAKTGSILYWFNIAAAVAVFGWLIWRYVRTVEARPRFKPTDVVFQEWFASGCSQKNIIAKLGGGRNCVRLVVTREFLWVTSWFPFSLITPYYDMEHIIPLGAILSVRRSIFLGRMTLLLTYRGANGIEHTLRLISRKPDDFIRSLGVNIKDESRN